MKKNLNISMLLCAVLLLGTSSLATADPVELYVDSAPNVYGSPAWAPWWNQTKADVTAGTFTNLRTGTYPGTNQIDPYDEIVYNTGDLGKRLHWIYWVPSETISSLTGRFEVKWVIDWDGDDWTYEGGAWAPDGPDVGWSQPSNWENYSNGVIGSLGFAWWATDDDASPYNTDSNPYNEVDQADIDALRELVLDDQTFATGYVRMKDDAGAWQTYELKVNVVPVPGAVLLGVLGLGAAGIKLRKRA